MIINQHYLINLKRRPERLYVWIGHQSAMDFDFPKLTILEAVDAQDFKDVSEIAKYAISLGFDYWEPLLANNNTHIIHRGLAAGALSTLLICREIYRKNSDDFSILWEDDEVLTIPYQGFEHLVLPEQTSIITFSKSFWGNTEDTVRKWTEKTVHKDLPFYNGCVGTGFLHCYGINSEGAKKLIDLHKENVCDYMCLEGLMVISSNMKNMYTYIPNITKETQISGIITDIHLDMPTPPPWQIITAKDL